MGIKDRHAQGMEEGIAIGHTRVYQEAKQVIAMSLLEIGMHEKDVLELTNLTNCELHEIKVA